MRMYAAQYNVMEGVQEIAALAIRTCGGQSMLKSMPLERMYRDSRCGALMLPYTSEIMEDYLSVLTLYDMDEVEDGPRRRRRRALLALARRQRLAQGTALSHGPRSR